MKISLEFTEDELDDLRCMVADSRTLQAQDHERNHPAVCRLHCSDIIADHDRWLERIEEAQERLADK
jgi:hypothetical protein